MDLTFDQLDFEEWLRELHEGLQMQWLNGRFRPIGSTMVAALSSTSQQRRPNAPKKGPSEIAPILRRFNVSPQLAQLFERRRIRRRLRGNPAQLKCDSERIRRGIVRFGLVVAAHVRPSVTRPIAGPFPEASICCSEIIAPCGGGSRSGEQPSASAIDGARPSACGRLNSPSRLSKNEADYFDLAELDWPKKRPLTRSSSDT